MIKTTALEIRQNWVWHSALPLRWVNLLNLGQEVLLIPQSGFPSVTGILIPAFWGLSGFLELKLVKYLLCCAVLSCSVILTLCDPMDCSYQAPLSIGIPVKNTGLGCHALLRGIFPTQGLNQGFLPCRWILYHLSHQRSPWILEWVAYPFSRGSSQPKN